MRINCRSRPTSVFDPPRDRARVPAANRLRHDLHDVIAMPVRQARQRTPRKPVDHRAQRRVFTQSPAKSGHAGAEFAAKTRCTARYTTRGAQHGNQAGAAAFPHRIEPGGKGRIGERIGLDPARRARPSRDRGSDRAPACPAFHRSAAAADDRDRPRFRRAAHRSQSSSALASRSSSRAQRIKVLVRSRIIRRSAGSLASSSIPARRNRPSISGIWRPSAIIPANTCPSNGAKSIRSIWFLRHGLGRTPDFIGIERFPGRRRSGWSGCPPMRPEELANPDPAGLDRYPPSMPAASSPCSRRATTCGVRKLARRNSARAVGNAGPCSPE